MLERFFSKFQVTENVGENLESIGSIKNVDNDFRECTALLGGKIFNKGIYRFFRADMINSATESLERVFPEYKNRIVVFGCDWLGRQFAVDWKRNEQGKPSVLLVEPGSGEAFEVPASIVDFHEIELTEYTADSLALVAFESWISQNSPINWGYCVGYKIPLFLGGSDTLENMELIDMDVYVEICGQLRQKTRDLKPGQRIGNITID